MWRLHEVQVSMSTNKALLELCLARIYGCFQAAVAELRSYNRDCVALKLEVFIISPFPGNVSSPAESLGRSVAHNPAAALGE